MRNPNASSSLPLSAAPTREDSSTGGATPHPHPIFSFFHHHFSRLGSEISARFEASKHFFRGATNFRPPPFFPSFASVSQRQQRGWGEPSGTHLYDVAMGLDDVAKALAGTAVYTVSNSNNEFVLISDPNNSLKSLGLLCFRREDAQALLAQVRLRQPVFGRGARVVPITLDQVYMLKVEGIAFRFLPDPLQIKNALELKAADMTNGFDGIPVFQSDLLVAKRKNKRYCPIYFQKEDIERDLSKFSKASRGSGFSQHIMVGSLEDVLKKMEMNDKNSGWEDMIFIPPGKSYSQHINEVPA